MDMRLMYDSLNRRPLSMSTVRPFKQEKTTQGNKQTSALNEQAQCDGHQSRAARPSHEGVRGTNVSKTAESRVAGMAGTLPAHQQNTGVSAGKDTIPLQQRPSSNCAIGALQEWICGGWDETVEVLFDHLTRLACESLRPSSQSGEHYESFGEISVARAVNLHVLKTRT